MAVKIVPKDAADDTRRRPLPSSQTLDGFGAIGVNFRTADLALRSRVGFTSDTAETFLVGLRNQGIPECVVLSTCNRTEIYFTEARAAHIEAWLSICCGVSPHHLPEHIYRLSGAHAALHLFEVAAGLDSAVLGETEILAQIKGAWDQSRRLGMVAAPLEILLQRALIASKRVRSETGVSRHVTSVASLAVRQAKEKVEGFAGRNILLVGAGTTAERVAKELALADPGNLVIVNRTLANAERLAESCRAKALGLDRFKTALEEADAVFLAVGVPSPLLLKSALSDRKRELLVVDLSVPRASEQAVGELALVTTINLDTLQDQCEANAELRLAEVPKGLRILNQELYAFAEQCVVRDATGTIQALQAEIERVRQENLSYMAERLANISDEARALVEEMSVRMANGLLQRPIKKLRDPLLDQEARDLIAEAFGVSQAGDHAI